MRRTSAYFIRLLLIFISGPVPLIAQDTLLIPLKIKIGLEASGPAIYISDKNVLNAEGSVSVDVNEKRSWAFGAGYLNYKYSQYNYEYLNNGFFVKAGADFNLLKPEKSMGRYWGGIGLRYGLSLFSSETPSFKQDNYWGTTYSSIRKTTSWGHFIEASPGVRAEVFKNFSMGWTVSLRMMLYTGNSKDLKPIYFPGYGNGSKSFSSGMSYFIVWNIPYKKITVITKKEEPPEPDDNFDMGTGSQGTGIRQ